MTSTISSARGMRSPTSVVLMRSTMEGADQRVHGHHAFPFTAMTRPSAS